MLSVIRVTCSSVDSSVSPSALRAHRRCQHTRERKDTINTAVTKNITKEFH